MWKILILIFNRYLFPVSIIDVTKVGRCEPHFNDGKPREGWPASVFTFLDCQMPDIRFQPWISIWFVSSCWRDSIRPSNAPPESFRGSFLDSYREGGAFEKNPSKGARYFNAATMVRHYVYDHLTGSWSQSLWCLDSS